jgi:hypothetical protein
MPTSDSADKFLDFCRHRYYDKSHTRFVTDADVSHCGFFSGKGLSMTTQTSKGTDPCANAKQAYKDARATEDQCDQAFKKASSELIQYQELMHIDPELCSTIWGKLSLGKWPEKAFGMSEDGYPATEHAQLCSAVLKKKRGHKAAQESATKAKAALDKCKGTKEYINWLRSQGQPESPDGGQDDSPADTEDSGQEDSSEAPADTDQGTVLAGNDRCGQPRTGHGHKGEPCHVLLGKDGICQYHG